MLFLAKNIGSRDGVFLLADLADNFLQDVAETITEGSMVGHLQANYKILFKIRMF